MYLARSAQAEEVFRRELERAIRLIRENPPRNVAPLPSRDSRRIVLTGFPYSIVYTTDGSYSLVLAIAHAKQKPGYVCHVTRLQTCSLKRHVIVPNRQAVP